MNIKIKNTYPSKMVAIAVFRAGTTRQHKMILCGEERNIIKYAESYAFKNLYALYDCTIEAVAIFATELNDISSVINEIQTIYKIDELITDL